MLHSSSKKYQIGQTILSAHSFHWIKNRYDVDIHRQGHLLYARANVLSCKFGSIPMLRLLRMHPLQKRKRPWGVSSRLLREPHKGSSPLQEQQAISAELQSYLQPGNLDSEEDPLDWWRERQKLFPRLSKLVKKYLCILATSSSSEMEFNTGRNMVTCLCSSLKPENVERLVFLSKNL